MATESAVDLETVALVISRLRALLQHARGLKPESTVEPPLPTAELAAAVQALHDGFDSRYDQTYRYLAVETASRELFYSLVTSMDIKDPSFVEVWNLLDILQVCGDYGRCTPELTCWLLEELLDYQTTPGCRTVFDYLESRRERLARKDFHKKNLIFLRCCNELLRRLSRAEDAMFCGRVFFFLFQTFPLGDKSSVNLRGEFHTENVTKFDVAEAKTTDGEHIDQMDIDSKPSTPAAEEGTPQPITSSKAGGKAVPLRATAKKSVEEEVLSTSQLYPVFWRLQHDFAEPTRLFDGKNFATFKKGLAYTITKFKKTPTVIQTKAVESDSRESRMKLSGDVGQDGVSDHTADEYNPKYLTSRDLFDLELSDLAFQRHILVQALILIDFLLSLTEKAKKRLSELPTSNKSMVYAFTLGEDDTKWANSTRSAITSYLSSSNEGRHYSRMVETVLSRDRNWVRWKIESCPSIVRGPVTTEEEMNARRGARDATRPRRIPDKPMGAMDLAFLEDDNDGGLDALKDPSRHTAPLIEQLVDAVKTDKLDLDMAMDEAETSSLTNAIHNAKWRALRQARATNLSLLDQVESTKDLDEMLSKVPTEWSSLEQAGDGASPAAAASIGEVMLEAPTVSTKAADEDDMMTDATEKGLA